MTDRRTVVLGASTNPARYSNRAVRMLLDHGYTPLPVHPSGQAVHDQPCYRTLNHVPGPVDTITVYLSAHHSEALVPAMLNLKPRRIILNPGAETAVISNAGREAGIKVVQACTLVLLATGQYA